VKSEALELCSLATEGTQEFAAATQNLKGGSKFFTFHFYLLLFFCTFAAAIQGVPTGVG